MSLAKQNPYAARLPLATNTDLRRRHKWGERQGQSLQVVVSLREMGIYRVHQSASHRSAADQLPRRRHVRLRASCGADNRILPEPYPYPTCSRCSSSSRILCLRALFARHASSNDFRASDSWWHIWRQLCGTAWWQKSCVRQCHGEGLQLPTITSIPCRLYAPVLWEWHGHESCVG